MKRLARSFSFFVMVNAIILSSACAPKGGGSPSIAEADGGALPVFQGTVSGGGGNGCDGRAVESYAKKITELEEFKLFIRPVLRRLTEESADPLVAYLLWAAEEKAWYFVPCELENLPTTQIGVALKSDQLALHGEHGVYIRAVDDANNQGRQATYFQKRGKARAALLLHEMVMGARLLMKRPAAEQCKALAKKDSKICADPELMAIAESRSVDPTKMNEMDAADHEAIRAMTAFLAQRESDFTAENMSATRERLGFRFPWSRAQSTLSFSDIAVAFARSRQMYDRFQVTGTQNDSAPNGGRTSIKSAANPSHPYFKNYPMTCSIDLQTQFGLYMQVAMASAIDSADGAAMSKFKTALGLQNIGSVCEENASQIHVSSVIVRDGETLVSRQAECERKRLGTAYEYTRSFNVPETGFSARGILRDGITYDEVSFEIAAPNYYLWPTLRNKPNEINRIRILLTRGEAPRVYSLSIEPLQVLRTQGDQDSSERLPIPGAPAIECQNMNLLSHP